MQINISPTNQKEHAASLTEDNVRKIATHMTHDVNTARKSYQHLTERQLSGHIL